MIEEIHGGAVVAEDEFHGLGDDLFPHDKKSADEILGPEDKPNKGPRIKKTLRQKALRVMLKRSGLKSLPPLDQILQHKEGPRFPISEIGFLSQDNPKDPLMAELAKECPVRNRINRDDVIKARVLVVGTQILKARRMWTPLHVAQLERNENNKFARLECVSGRHRLAFLAIAYGSDIKVPVYLETMSLGAAREATAVANDSRPVKALERASYAVLRETGCDQDQDALYDKIATLKTNVGKYCVFSVIERGYPDRLTFKMSERSSRPDGGITTVSNVESFWKEAISWKRGVERKVFDAELLETVKFLNAFVDSIRKIQGFNPSLHLSANVMKAVGRYYWTFRTISQKNALELCDALARTVVLTDTDKKRYDEIGIEIARRMTES